MKRYCVQLNDGSFANVIGDRMEVVDNMLYVYNGQRLEVLADLSVVLYARSCDLEGRREVSHETQ